MFQRIGPKAFKKDLRNIKFLDAALDHPHKAFKAIHIAGTNGKGSTSFFLASALAAQGFKVGLYTSPHYKTYRERIKVNGKMISKSGVKRFINLLHEKSVFESEFKPSFFEISVAMAFNHFREEEVDYAIIETGLGGRLDSTNIITPVLSVITNIGFDHTEFLGNTLKKIAAEKAGIIKKSIPVLIGKRQEECASVFEKVAAKRKAGLSWADDKPTSFSKEFKKAYPAYLIENANTAYKALQYIVPEISVKKAVEIWNRDLSKWGFYGRFQILSDSPKVIADSAHNLQGLQALFTQIDKLQYEELHIVLGVVKDKDLDKVLPLFSHEAKYYFVQANVPRALDKDILQKRALDVGMSGKTYNSVSRGLHYARRAAGKKDLVLVTGSIFTVAEVV